MATSDATPPCDLTGYEVLVCVCGGIAAYKVCTAVSRLCQRGAGVTVAMTQAGTEFVGPTTFRGLTGRAVLVDQWASGPDCVFPHISRTELADLILVAPATANIIGKIAGGIADDLVSTMIASADSPILLAPAMNDRMWANPIVQKNTERLAQVGMSFVGPAEGHLACGAQGAGRMVEPEDIVDTVATQLKTDPPKSATL